MESRKEKNYDMYFDIWKNAKYPTHKDKALAMFRKYCRYGNLTSTSFFENCTAGLLNVNKKYAEEISRIIKEYDSIPADSITRSIEYLIYRLYTVLKLHKTSINKNGDLHTILVIIEEQTNFPATSYIYLYQLVNGNINHCKNWSEAFREEKLCLEHDVKITNEVWDNIKNDNNLIEIIARKENSLNCFLIEKFDNNDDLRTLYIEALKNRNYSLAHRSFWKLHSIQINYKSSCNKKSFEFNIEKQIMKSKKDFISSDLLIEYFNHFPDEEKANALNFFFNLYSIKEYINNWAKIENRICSDLNFSKYFKDFFISLAKNKSCDIPTGMKFFLERKLVNINDRSMIIDMQKVYSEIVNNILTFTVTYSCNAMEIQLRMIKLLFDYSHPAMIALNKFVTIDILDKAHVIEKRDREMNLYSALCKADSVYYAFLSLQKLVSPQLLEIIRDMQNKYRQSFTFFLCSKNKNSPVSELIPDVVSNVVKFSMR